MDFQFPENFLFADSHEYASKEDALVRVGISAFAVDQLGDIVFLELPEVGDSVQQGKSFGSVESVKAVEEMNSPITGKVLEINDSVLDDPEKLQTDPHGAGWLLLIKPNDMNELTSLMSGKDYSQKIASK